MARIIDGKGIAEVIRKEMKDEVALLTKEGRAPGLAVILVGDDPASKTYVGSKERAARELGIYSKVIRREAGISQDELIGLIRELNEDRNIDGILVQLPLPAHIDEKAIIEAIDPGKDVDGFHPVNTGRLFNSQVDVPRFEPCTPLGIMELLEREGIEIEGKKAVVVGRSNIVGKPIACLLLEKNATVTICHSRTRELAKETAQADILVAAVGKPAFIDGSMVKEGVIAIDVGINRVDGKLVGDLDFPSVEKKSSYITPVPGGVGPMTIAMLMKNTIKARKYHGV
ncbi:MAG TPA: bifunctional methylenetetrahydrofolate dehydrogenase/methenyltetrahydrofolate cyclohydrolase FolD [Halanaerobiaceae bacterium]|nr:bifunctional methylenetetrahydrofolate dehydrogenase/methenyltetrahydrofolate cyclohydrolase FolD [Bacillota bacterium]HHU92927.1 bifunctional methylenetetrahydrofolate dehydrogenase/methenyltetrahydrofolate cyclohydrolase FolD [Halanaerobiaceae bacterium]HOA41107.1 bifunctional methylenetetrahydrofolate dehydrogenase/methenyltetrahydrofolate cyclohydrolase FolD [Halanaerobiales bacterium]HPZ63390.1 bifunctional methylenetetrahydrofolate dehydrogenase/methenyltetrahydrofolate cyclohydrolase F